jgi:beta-phosphoglucomutase-like phosphatase (HAD superfamily)
MFCIFDMDGLLLNTEEIYSKVTQQILDNFNVKFTYELKMKMMGLKQQDAAEILIKETG